MLDFDEYLLLWLNISDILAELHHGLSTYKSRMVSMPLHPECAPHLFSIKSSQKTFASSQLSNIFVVACSESQMV